MRAASLTLTLAVLTAGPVYAEEPPADAPTPAEPAKAEAVAAPSAEKKPLAASAPAQPAAAAEPAHAAAPPAPADAPDGAQLEVGIAQVGGGTGLTSSSTGSLQQPVPALSGNLRFGGYFKGHHSLSIGLSLSYISQSQFGSDFTFIDLVFAPTYRYHLTPLRPWALSPFVDVEVQVGVAHLSGSGFGNTDTNVVPFGAAAGVGGEYLFGDRLGFVVLAGARFVTYSFGGTPGVSNTGTTVTSIQVWGAAAVSLHF